MLLQKLGNNGGSVVITSPEASSGKTTVSILLARSLAAMGKRTLLVDADLLHPSASRYFELIDQRGLCCVVSGDLSDEDAIIPTDNENLFILPTGERHARGNRDVLANGAFAAALQRWKSQFDYVLIDSPPVLAMIDTLTKNRAKASESKILDEMGLTPKQYGVITLHRPSNVDDKENLSSILDAFDEIGRDMKLVFPMHPRTRKNIESMNWSAMRTLRGANDFIHTSC